MSRFTDLVEKKILESMAKGEFENLPGEGKPLDLEDDAFVPTEMRMAYKVLRNAGVVPREVTVLQEIHEMKEKLKSETGLSPDERQQLEKKIAIKQSEVALAVERMQKTK
jgi:hypothetical protein